MAILRVIQGPNSGHEFELLPGQVWIGRLPTCNIVLDHRAVSRQHAKIECVDDKFFIQDLNSRNGTRINGQRRERHRLAHNDRITICCYEFAFADEPSISMTDDDTVKDAEKPARAVAHQNGDNR